MADVTIKLARIAERDGLVFLCDKDGKELPFQVVPVAAEAEMIAAYLAGNRTYWHETDEEPKVNPSKWRNGTPEEATEAGYQAMLSAAKVDVSAALVKVPERKKIRAVIGKNDWDEVWMALDWNACLDELERS